MEKVIEVEINGKKETITIKQWDWVTKQRIIKKSSTVQYAGDGAQRVEFNLDDFNIRQVLACITNAPFPVTEEGLANVPIEVMEKIANEIFALNGLTEREKKA